MCDRRYRTGKTGHIWGLLMALLLGAQLSAQTAVATHMKKDDPVTQQIAAHLKKAEKRAFYGESMLASGHEAVAEILRASKAFQYISAHPLEACPVLMHRFQSGEARLPEVRMFYFMLMGETGCLEALPLLQYQLENSAWKTDEALDSPWNPFRQNVLAIGKMIKADYKGLQVAEMIARREEIVQVARDFRD